MFVSYPICYKIPIAVFWQKIFYILLSFIKNLFSNSIWLILTCKLKLNCRDFWRVTVMTSSSRLHVIVEYSFLFPLVKNGENRPRSEKVIVENKVAPFSRTRCKTDEDYSPRRQWTMNMTYRNIQYNQKKEKNTIEIFNRMHSKRQLKLWFDVVTMNVDTLWLIVYIVGALCGLMVIFLIFAVFYIVLTHHWVTVTQYCFYC